jgi:hypothetical protein
VAVAVAAVAVAAMAAMTNQSEVMRTFIRSSPD